MPSHFDGFVPIHSIFYSIFHPTEGTKVRFQFPPDSLENSGIRFDTIKNYVIPKPQLCNKLLTFKFQSYRLVCYPVNINASYYARNTFRFNFVFIFPYDSATSPYEPAIARLGKMFRVLEEQSQVLSKIEKDPIYYHLKKQDTQPTEQMNEESETKGHASTVNDKVTQRGQSPAKYHEIMEQLAKNERQLYIEDIITKLYEDLNNYSECLIPMDSGNAIDIKLFPLLEPPSSCLSYEDVPVSKVNLIKLIDANWDPTMLKIVPFINGVSSIAKIARSSSTDVKLVMECIKHLLYYRCVVLVDIFQFSNIYAPTSQIREFLMDHSMARECQQYVISSENSELHSLPFEGRPAATSRNHTSSTNTIETLDNMRNSKRTESFSSTAENVKLNIGNTVYKVPSFTNSSTNFDGNHTSIPEELSKRILPTRSCLFDLYRSFSQSQTVFDWYRLNYDVIRENQIDVRRLVTFGIVRKLIYRCYSYPVAKTIGTLEMIKRFDYLSESDVFSGSKGANSGSLFSTSDIRVDYGEPSYRAKPMYLSNSKSTGSNEALIDKYTKLTMKDGLPSSIETISKNYNALKYEQHNKSGRKPSVSTLGTAKIMFEMDTNNPGYENRTSVTDATKGLKKQRQQEITLLQSVKNVDSFDKIATKLELNKEDVEGILRGTGEYNIINS